VLKSPSSAWPRRLFSLGFQATVLVAYLGSLGGSKLSKPRTEFPPLSHQASFCVTPGTLIMSNNTQRSRQLQTRGWATIATCNKHDNPKPLPCAFRLRESRTVAGTRVMVTQRRSLLQKSMHGKHEQTYHFPCLFAAFRHIPCQRQTCRHATNRARFQITAG
jgi:hypothetical protein